MKITPIEIRKQDFNKVFRGYEKEEVDAFLKSLSHEWEKLLDENREIKKRLEIAEKEIVHLREVESSLFKTIKNAEDTGASLIDHAQRQSDLHLREAQINAEAIMSEARNRAKITIEEAEMEAKTLVGNLQDEVTLLQKEYKDIEFKKTNSLQEIQALAESLLDRVQREHAKINRQDTEQRIEKVVQAAKSINTEVKKDFSEHQLKTSIRPSASSIAEPKQEQSSLFNTKPVTDKEIIGQTSEGQKPEDVKAVIQEKHTPVENDVPPSESKEGSGSFFDTI